MIVDFCTLLMLLFYRELQVHCDAHEESPAAKGLPEDASMDHALRLFTSPMVIGSNGGVPCRIDYLSVCNLVVIDEYTVLRRHVDLRLPD